jgi:hypothetical protein
LGRLQIGRPHADWRTPLTGYYRGLRAGTEKAQPGRGGGRRQRRFEGDTHAGVASQACDQAWHAASHLA